MDEIPPEVEDNLGYYVYMYIDPRDKRPFYVGKGSGSRVLSHLSDDNESRKTRVIDSIRDDGLSPELFIVQHGIKKEETALRIETALIDCLGIEGLTNAVRGWGSEKFGLVSLAEHIDRTRAKSVRIKHSVIMLNLRKHFRYGMDLDELYETTRGVWRAVRHDREYALGVYKGVVQCVFKIDMEYLLMKPLKTNLYGYFQQQNVTLPEILEECLKDYLMIFVKIYWEISLLNSPNG